MNMMICNKCNEQIPEDSRFCPFCGYRLATAAKSSVAEPIAISANATPDTMVKRALLLIEDGLFDRADQYLEVILDQDPENAQAYLGKLMIDLRVNTQEQLAEQEQPFDRNGNYVKAVRFGDEKLVCLLNGYISQINARSIVALKEEKYANAVFYFKNAKNCSELETARTLLEELQDYKDSRELLTKISEVEAEMKEKIEAAKKKDEIYQTAYREAQAYDITCQENAIRLFEQISDWRDSRHQIEKAQQKINMIKVQEQKVKEQKEQEVREAIRARELRERKEIAGVVVTFLFVIFLLLVFWGVFSN